jgi:AbrB family looped-hinge helix DNA binding protein
MDPDKIYTAEIKARGQLTIPKQIREAGDLYEGETVSLIPVGDALLIAPKRLELEEARREIRKILKSTGVSLDVLMAGLPGERESLYREKYGRKKA